MAKFRTWAWWITHPKANWDHMLGDLKWKKRIVLLLPISVLAMVGLSVIFIVD